MTYLRFALLVDSSVELAGCRKGNTKIVWVHSSAVYYRYLQQANIVMNESGYFDLI